MCSDPGVIGARHHRVVARRRKQPAAGHARILPGHKQHRQTFIPPLMQVEPRRELSWYDEMLPDFLWIALMLGRRSDWRAVYSALEVVDRFVPPGQRFADGRLSTFALVPEKARPAARAALHHEAPHALPTQFGHALGLYSTCPARWLYEDWLTRHEPDPEIGTPLLRSLVKDHVDKSSVAATRLRMAAFSRRVTHGKISHPGTGVFGLFPKYPSGLSTSEQRQVESALRALWLNLFGVEVGEHPDVLDWPRDFWRRNRELVPCRIHLDREERQVTEEDGPLDPEPLMQLSEMRALLDVLDDLGDYLRSEQIAFLKEPSSDEPNVVLLGLASRLYRLLYAFLERPSAWTPDAAGFHIRPLVDARILVGWLITRNDPAIFAAYREYGRGRLKLLRDHIKADLGKNLDDIARNALNHLDQRVNLERDEAFQPVQLGAFADTSPRTMAIEAGLKREYDLSYAPLSSSNHGEWPTVRDNDTLICAEPLHRNHRVGAFRPPSRIIDASFPVSGFELARGGISEVFDHCGRDVRHCFDATEAALKRAIYADPPDEEPQATAD